MSAACLFARHAMDDGRPRNCSPGDVARHDRDEHASRTSAGGRRVAQRDIHYALSNPEPGWANAHCCVLRRITSSTSGRSGAQLLLDALVKARDIDDDALVRAVPDRLLLVVGLDLEYERAAVDPQQFGRRPDAHSDRGGGEMADIEVDAETLMTIWEQLLDGRER